MMTHYAATGTRTLCGRTLSDRMRLDPLWPDFLARYERAPDECCAACLRYARKWQRFARDLAAANARRSRMAGLDGPASG